MSTSKFYGETVVRMMISRCCHSDSEVKNDPLSKCVGLIYLFCIVLLNGPL